MRLPFGLLDTERAELRQARELQDNVVVARHPKHHRSPQNPFDDGSGGAATFFSIVFVTADPNGGGNGGGNNGGNGGGINGGGGNQQAAPTMPGAMEQSGDPTPTVFAPVPIQTPSQQQPTFQQPPPTHATPHTTHTPSPTKHATVQHTSFDSAAVQTAAPTNAIANGAVSSPSASPSAQAEQQPTGMTTGAKAGVAVGVILGLGLLAGLAFFAFRMMKRKREEAEDEKHNPFSDSAAPISTPPTAHSGFAPPPVATMQNLPRPSTANTHTNPFNAPSANVSTRNLDSPLPAPPVNPFGNQAALASQSSFNGSIPIGDETHSNVTTPVTPLSQDSDKEMVGAAVGGMAAGAALGGAAGAMSRNNAPRALELDATRPAPPFAQQGMPQSPAASAYSFTSQSGAVAAAAVAGAPPPPTSNVHRVQLDFVPSMHDEMELKQGELVRMLHEYDDGWALCTKFDKSSKGVCPRTCLSQKPLQPRARNGPPPPRTPGAAGPSPRGPLPPGRTASPAPSQRGPPRPHGPPSRSASPAPGGPHPNMQNWPAKPTNASTISSNHLSNWPAQPVNMIQRSMSPGPYGGGPQQQNAQRPQQPIKRRSQSVGGGINMPKPLSTGFDEFPLPIQGTPTSATAPSPVSVSRKPVPGQ